ncbi:MAG: sensor histidine kinase [Planctomycetota bacterium]|jgi:signal transduction histidine kinase
MLAVTENNKSDNEKIVAENCKGIRALAEASPGPVLVFKQNDMSLLYANEKFRDDFDIESDQVEIRPERIYWQLLMDLRQGDGIRQEMHIRVADDSSLCLVLNAVSLSDENTDLVFTHVERAEQRDDAGTSKSSADAIQNISNLMIALSARVENLSEVLEGKGDSISGEPLGALGASATKEELAAKVSLLDRELGDFRSARSNCREWIARISDGLNDVDNVLRLHMDSGYRTCSETTDVAAMFEHAVGSSADMLKEWGITTEIVVDGSPRACLPGYVLVAVVANLVKNAAQVMFNHMTFQPSIKLRAAYVNPKLIQIEVEDNGPGIPESRKDKIFDRGFTTNLKAQGNGLAFCREAMTEIGGRIELGAPTDHAGSIFRLSVPLS